MSVLQKLLTRLPRMCWRVSYENRLSGPEILQALKFVG